MEWQPDRDAGIGKVSVRADRRDFFREIAFLRVAFDRWKD